MQTLSAVMGAVATKVVISVLPDITCTEAYQSVRWLPYTRRVHFLALLQKTIWLHCGSICKLYACARWHFQHKLMVCHHQYTSISSNTSQAQAGRQTETLYLTIMTTMNKPQQPLPDMYMSVSSQYQQRCTLGPVYCSVVDEVCCS